jgi:RNA polymerase sigma-70 factor, ECF subfamily
VTDEERRARFENVFRDYYDTVLAYALARADAETARDAAAATFLVAWRRLSELPERPAAWLLAVTRRTLADQRRTRDRYASLARKLAAQPEAVKTEPDPGEEIDRRDAVLAALASLRPADQELLRLVAWEGLTNTEIAVVLSCPRLVVGARLHRARQRFRTALAACDVAGPETPTGCVAQVPYPITLEDRCAD